LNYHKKMLYLSYIENEKRLRNAGHVKLEGRANRLVLDMHVNLRSNTPKDNTLHNKFEVFINSDTTSLSLGMIYLKSGVGNFRKEIIDQFTFMDVCNVQVKINENTYVVGKIRDCKKVEPKTEKMAKQFQTEPEGKEWQFTVKPVESVDEVVEVIAASKVEGELQMDEISEFADNLDLGEELISATMQTPDPEWDEVSECIQNSTPVSQENIRQILHDIRMTPDKFEQLLKNYENIKPYADERVYISIEPKDFVIMSSEFQHLAHNSFLLHGYYNYRHIILGKEGDNYYLGVPGVYYEREKNVALMFGFEVFECEGGKPKSGMFGYYLKKVKL